MEKRGRGRPLEPFSSAFQTALKSGHPAFRPGLVEIVNRDVLPTAKELAADRRNVLNATRKRNRCARQTERRELIEFFVQCHPEKSASQVAGLLKGYAPKFSRACPASVRPGGELAEFGLGEAYWMRRGSAHWVAIEHLNAAGDAAMRVSLRTLRSDITSIRNNWQP